MFSFALSKTGGLEFRPPKTASGADAARTLDSVFDRGAPFAGDHRVKLRPSGPNRILVETVDLRG